MKRVYFKYEYGFVSIDNNFIYFSSTGNGQELKELTEKDQAINKKHKRTKFKTVLFFLLFAVVCFWLLYRQLSNSGLSIVFVVLASIGGFQLYHYLRTEIGARFKIPLHKVQDVKIGEQIAFVIFKNTADELEEYKINNFKDKGQRILTEFKEDLKQYK